MKRDFHIENLTCCSLELHWNCIKNKNEKNSLESYELYQREGRENILTDFWNYKLIHKCKNTSYEVINLKPNQDYSFRLDIIDKKNNSTESKSVEVKTLKLSPPAILSEQSIENSNGHFLEKKDKLSDFQKEIIKNCSKLIFEENNENILKGDFNGIIIKITHEIQKDIYYISFDFNSDYFEEFFKQYLKEYDTNIIIPCHFIIQKLPTIFILNLLEKSSIIFTGKRMGGVIASSLAFYIMYIGQSMNINYENAFLKSGKKSIGTVTFGSSSFLNNLNAAVKMKKVASYFYHIKGEFDYIPEIIDFISDGNENNIPKDKLKALLNIFNANELKNEKIKILNNFLEDINFTKNNVELFINKLVKIPFGYYFVMLKSDFSLISINEKTFQDFYYFKRFNKIKNICHLQEYKNLESNIEFSKKALEYLVNKNNELEIIKIIRRNINNEKPQSDSEKSTKAIIKFELNKSDNNIITPDIIQKIILFCSPNIDIIEIDNRDIYYDNEKDITAYTNLNENLNINEACIHIFFSGEIKIKYILNIKGSGPTQQMLYDSLEKIFLIPFFKLFEIFYTSYGEEEKEEKKEESNDKKLALENKKNKYNKLKEDNFGKNFEELKILKPFEKQIKILNELLFFTRPDILANKEDIFIKLYVEKELKNSENLEENHKSNIMESLNDNLKKYYGLAKNLQKDQGFNCLDSKNNSIAKKISFPYNFEGKNQKKLFMCKFERVKEKNFISQKFDDSYIKHFFIESYIMEVLRNIENKIKDISNNIKDYLNKNIGEYYKTYIIPNVYFIRMLILASIESGDFIKFYHHINWAKFFYHLKLTNLFMIKNLFPNMRDEYFEKDFEKTFTKEKIEEIHMKNIFFKKKMKKVINSNIDNIDNSFENPSRIFTFLNFSNINFINNISENINRIKNFSNYSENSKIGKKYYESFLQLLNNYSNDFSEDIETSIYDNLKEENNSRDNNLLTILDMMNDFIDDKESKKGFLALLKQSFLLGQLRTNIVINNILIFLFYRKMNILLAYLEKKKQVNLH